MAQGGEVICGARWRLAWAGVAGVKAGVADCICAGSIREGATTRGGSEGKGRTKEETGRRRRRRRLGVRSGHMDGLLLGIKRQAVLGGPEWWKCAMMARHSASMDGRPKAGPQTWRSSMAATFGDGSKLRLDGVSASRTANDSSDLRNQESPGRAGTSCGGRCTPQNRNGQECEGDNKLQRPRVSSSAAAEVVVTCDGG